MGDALGVPTLPVDVWSKHVPITYDEPTSTYIAYLLNDIEAPHVYAEFIHILAVAEEGSRIIIKINTPGGFADTTIQIHDAIRTTHATTHAEILGQASSAGSMIALMCDHLYVAPNTSMLCHSSAYGIGGKAVDIFDHALHNIELNREFFEDVYKKFLTKKEIKRILRGKELYLNATEIAERWEGVIKYRHKQVLKQQATELEEQLAAARLFIEQNTGS